MIKLNKTIEAARIQGFQWSKKEYRFENEVISTELDEQIFQSLVQRYKEIPRNSGNGSSIDIPFDLSGYIMEIDTEKIDSDYMDSRFQKYIKELQKGSSPEVVEQALEELHYYFASLSQEDQKYANIFLHDVQSGEVFVEAGKSLLDYISEYRYQAQNDRIHRFAKTFGLDEEKLRNIMSLRITETNINEFGRFSELIKTVDKEKAKKYFEEKEGKRLNPPKVNIRMDQCLRKFILFGQYE